MREIKKDGYIFKPSTRKEKKYDVFDKQGNKIASFGAIRENGIPYEQYKDRIGIYSRYDHNDKERRERYRKRHNRPLIKNTPNFFARTYLW
jgi:hypothetical protein